MQLYLAGSRFCQHDLLENNLRFLRTFEISMLLCFSVNGLPEKLLLPGLLFDQAIMRFINGFN